MDIIGFVALGIGVALGFAAGAFLNGRRLSANNQVLATALNNMSQGLCMFDAETRLVIANGRYLEMYGISPVVARPGCTLRDLILHRIATGSFSGDADEYCRKVKASVASGKPSSFEVTSPNGRTIAVLQKPMAGGGWIATHDDITERRSLEQQRASLAEQEGQRAMIDGAIKKFRDRVERVLKTVTESAASMHRTATALSGSSGQTSQRAEGAVQTSNEAAGSIDTAAVAADELSKSISEISRQLTQTTDVVRLTVQEAQTTNREIAGLANAAQKIGDVVKLIRDIAGQTNLLALNATIEAARAGAAGKGFAVVAAEVKSLAVQTAKATEDIAGQIAGVQASTTTAVDAIRRIPERMEQINSYASAVAASVEQQNSATGEISQHVASTASGTKVIVSVLGQLAGAATETKQAAQTALTASEAVAKGAESLRTEVETFLRTVAA